MEKKLAYLLILGIGGLAAYHLLKKPAASAKSFDDTPDELSREIDSDANVEKVQSTLPRFGVPKNIIPAKRAGIFAKSSYTSFANAAGYKNYVDVKNNSFFQPKLGMFHK